MRSIARCGALAIVASLISLVLVGCGDGPSAQAAGDDTDLSGRLVITGSSTMAPLVAEIGRRFESMHPDVRVDVQTGGSSRGIADPAAGLADIGMSSRALNDDERDGRRAHLLARDGVGFLVHADNPAAPTDVQLRGIMTGAVDDWSAVGGAPGAITFINRADGRSELELVTAHFAIDRADMTADLIAGENQQGIKLVAGDPGAITYMSIGTSAIEAGRGAPIRLLPLDGVSATRAAVAAGDFPLARPLLLITRSDATPLVEAFVAYGVSDAVHDLVEANSFAPVD